MQLSYSRKVIFNATASDIFNLRISDFFVVSVACGEICVRILSFVKFGQVAAEIWRYNDIMIFKMTAVRHVGFSKFDIFISKPLCACNYASPNSKFRLNRTIRSRVIAKKWFLIWRPSAILNFGIFLTFPSIGSKFASVYRISSYLDDSRLRYGYITIFKMAAFCHVRFIVTSSYCAGRLSLTLVTLC